jgi:integrase
MASGERRAASKWDPTGTPERLTARAVATFRSEQVRRDIADDKVMGLQLRVTRSGVKTWALRYRRKSDGRRRRYTLGLYPTISLEEARTLAREAVAAISRDADPVSGVQERKGAPTFADVVEEWTERHAKPNKGWRTVEDDQAMLRRHVLPQIGTMKAAEITKRDIIRMLDAVAVAPDARAKRKSAARKLTHRPNRAFELTRSILNWAVGRDIIKSNPMFGLQQPIKKEKPRERVLSADEIRTLWKALDRAPVKHTRLRRSADDFPMRRATALTLKLSLVTGQRIGEVAEAAMSEFDLNSDAPIWVIPGERTKNGEPNRVPLSPLALRVIAEAREVGGSSKWLFPNPQGDSPVDASAPTKALDRARPAIGLKNFRVHDLRRTAASHMAELGISPHSISLVLNHVSATKAPSSAKSTSITVGTTRSVSRSIRWALSSKRYSATKSPFRARLFRGLFSAFCDQ